MVNEAAKEPGTLRLRFCAGLFLIMLLVSLDDLWSVWKFSHGHGWHLKFSILVPWVFCLLIAVNVWIYATRKKMDRDVAAVFLMLLAFIVSSAYGTMWNLASLGH